MVDVLFEDKDLIVCIKPVGVLSQPGKESGENLLDILTTYLNEKKENFTMGLIHRLDRNVGGVMVYSKRKNTTAKLSQAIQERNFIKEYYAIIHGKPDENKGIFQDLLFKDSSKNKSYIVDKVRKGVKEASLEYEVLETKETQKGVLSLVRIKLHTGRTHQIRVQFAGRKMPLLGDGKYGSRDNENDIGLWSYRLAFRHPYRDKNIDITQLPPDVYPWNLFDLNN